MLKPDDTGVGLPREPVMHAALETFQTLETKIKHIKRDCRDQYDSLKALAKLYLERRCSHQDLHTSLSQENYEMVMKLVELM